MAHHGLNRRSVPLQLRHDPCIDAGDGSAVTAARLGGSAVLPLSYPRG
jgi:hypothetical protein